MLRRFDPDHLRRMYELFKWPEDPSEDGARRRYEESLEDLSKVFMHSWMRGILERDRVSVIDVCSGTGIGGIALARKLSEMGRSFDLTLVDLREDSLRIAADFARRELGVEVRTLPADARELHRIGLKADIAIMWGLSTPHFNPIDLMNVYGGISISLKDDGVMIVEEMDRFMILRNYKDFLLERYDEVPVITAHYKHDPLTGYTTRIIIRGEESHPMDVYFWDIAGSLSLAWVFFRDVDFIRTSAYRGCILAHRPRGEHLKELIVNKPCVYRTLL